MRVAVTLLALFFSVVVVSAREEKTNCATGMIKHSLINLLIVTKFSLMVFKKMHEVFNAKLTTLVVHLRGV